MIGDGNEGERDGHRDEGGDGLKPSTTMSVAKGLDGDYGMWMWM